MNTITHQETQALHAAVFTPAAATIAAYDLLLIPLSQLRPSSRNVRKSGGASIPELASSIARVGLLQNLTVTASSDGEHYEVVAGKRRLAALKLLAKRRKLAKTHEVPCLLVPDASARTVSLTENVQREAMHPGEQFEAFAALVAEGRPVEDIAADFGVTPLVVQRRLKLANVSPRLLADYRADTVTLDQLMALAITDDHSAQEAAFYDAPQWQRSAQALREHLTEREIDATRDALARFVGIETYEAAGGGVRRDLFSDTGGFVVTSGIFTDEAQAFATGRNIELMDGKALHALIRGVSAPAQATSAASAVVISAPACPICQNANGRIAKRGANSGNAFWGCSQYPACKGTRPV